MLRALLALVPALTLFADQPIATPQVGPARVFRLAVRSASNGTSFLRAVSTSDGKILVDGVAAPVPSFARLVDLFAIGDRYFLAYIGGQTLFLMPVGGTPVGMGDAAYAAASTSRGGTAALVTSGGELLVVNANLAVIGKTSIENGSSFIFPAAAASDDGFLAVWTTSALKVRAAFSTNGTAANVIDIGAGPAPGSVEDRPGVASDGSSFLAAWAVGNEIRSTLIARDGTSATTPRVLAAGPMIHGARVLWDGAAYAVFYTSRSRVFMQRVARDGAPLGDPVAISAPDRAATDPAAAASSGALLISWIDAAPCSSPSYDIASVILRGNQISGVPSDTPSAPGEQSQVSAVAIGDRIVTAFRETTDKSRLRIAGGVAEIASGIAPRSPALATDGTSIAVVWIDNRASDCMPVVMAAAAAGEPAILSADVSADTRPAIAWNGSEFVAVWERATDHALMAARIAADGTVIDTVPQLVVAGQAPLSFVSFNNAYARLIAVDGELILVWNAVRTSYIPLYPDPPGTFEIKAIRLSRSLMPLVSPHVISKRGINPAVATDGKDLLVAWRDESNAIATRLSSMLEPLGESVILANPKNGTVPSAAWNDDHYFVAVGDDVEVVSREGRPLAAAAHLDAATESIVAGDTVIYAKDGLLLARPLSAALPPPRRRGAGH